MTEESKFVARRFRNYLGDLVSVGVGIDNVQKEVFKRGLEKTVMSDGVLFPAALETMYDVDAIFNRRSDDSSEENK